MQKLPGRVYYVSSDKDDTVRIALDVLRDERDIISWFDTVKERIMKAEKIIDENPEHFVFERAAEEGGGTYTFVPMTLELYNKDVSHHILIPQQFADEESMLKAFEKTRESAW